VTAVTAQKILFFLAQGSEAEEIAAKLNVSTSCVRRVIEEFQSRKHEGVDGRTTNKTGKGWKNYYLGPL